MDVISARTPQVRWRRALEQLTTLGLSIILGLIVWLIAINQENPLIQDEFSEQIPVSVRGTPESLQLVQDLSRETVRVTLQAPRNSWDGLDAEDFTAFIDLSGLAAGVHDVPVQVDVVDPKVEIVEIQRPALRVQLDPLQTKFVPVRVDIMDSSAFGYDWQTPVVEPITVTVRGPATQVDQVVSVRAETYLRNAKSQVERTQTVTPQDAQGQTVSRVQVEPSSVRVVVPVEQWPGRKEVAVRVNLEGQPSPGYRLNSVRVNPSTVVLLGGTDVLANVPGFVETEPVSLTGATGEIQRRLQLLVPNGVSVLEGNAVDVTASVTPIEGGTTIRQTPVIQGLGQGLEAIVALEAVDVILSGPLPLLESLESDDIFVILDLAGLLPGNHIVSPRVVVPTGIRAEGVLPESVEVVISATTVTPDVTPAGTPSLTITPTLPITVTTPVTATVTPSGTPANTVTPTDTPTVTSSTPTPMSQLNPGNEVESR